MQKIWNLTSNWKEHSWNLNSSLSKIEEIKKNLEPTEWDTFWFKAAKFDLLQLLKNWDYKTFQKKIGMPNKLHDWLLWKTTLDYLINYLVSIEDKWSNVVSDTIKYLWNMFKYSKMKKKTESEDKPDPCCSESKQIKKINSVPEAQTNDSSTTIESTPTFWNIPIWKIISYPTIKNEETWNYCCSKTARLNGLHFWISLPKWSAYTAWILPTSWIIESIPKEKSWDIPNKNRTAIKEWDFDWIDKSANFADIYAESSTPYWHRAVAIRDTTWKRYVLDPYIKIKWKKSLMPIKLKDYITKWRKILKAHFYHSNWYNN